MSKNALRLLAALFAAALVMPGAVMAQTPQTTLKCDQDCVFKLEQGGWKCEPGSAGYDCQEQGPNCYFYNCATYVSLDAGGVPRHEAICPKDLPYLLAYASSHGMRTFIDAEMATGILTLNGPPDGSSQPVSPGAGSASP
jgi:hypothetical protein